jgi:hypothetical protein
MPDTAEVVAEVRITRVIGPPPKRWWFARLRYWRWDVAFYRVADIAGAPDRRLHVRTDFGYAFTQRRAMIRLGRRLPTRVRYLDGAGRSPRHGGADRCLTTFTPGSSTEVERR